MSMYRLFLKYTNHMIVLWKCTNVTRMNSMIFHSLVFPKIDKSQNVYVTACLFLNRQVTKYLYVTASVTHVLYAMVIKVQGINSHVQSSS